MHRKYNGLIFAIIQIFTFILIFFSLTLSTQYAKAYNKTNTAYSVICVDTGKILFSSNGNERLPMASTTKIMTALIILENCNPTEQVLIDDRAIGVEGSSVYLKPGEMLTVMDLLYCLMLRSGNDAAVALALHMCNNISDFAEIMNIRAKSIGLIDTNFVNPHGLHDDNHYTSSNDLAKLTALALNNSIFAQIVSTTNITIGEGIYRRNLKNKNKMLSLYDGANGVKTGYTKNSGRCLVSSATRNGKTLVCVVLNCNDTYGLSSQLLNKGFSAIAQNA